MKPAQIKRKVRYYASTYGLFGYEELTKALPGLSLSREYYEIYLQGLKPIQYKKKPGKTPLKRYGRWELVEKEMRNYNSSGNIAHLHKANAYRKNLKLPMIIQLRFEGERRQFSFSCFTKFTTFNMLYLKARECQSFEQWDELLKETARYTDLWWDEQGETPSGPNTLL